MREATAHAAGRINLIGEHTDYNDGLVLPIALGLGVSVTARTRGDRFVHVASDAAVTPREIAYEIGHERRDGTWGDRVRGITAALGERGELAGFDARVTSTLPAGAGLGSSAAFAVAFIRALSDLFALGLGDMEIVDLAHAVENGPFVGARSGLLDQLASVYGTRGAALFLDLRDRASDTIPLPRDLEVAVIDSGTRHAHATGGYNRRRAESEEAAAHLGVSSLRDLEGRPLESILDRLPPPLDRRVRHVLTENERVRSSVEALRADDVEQLGELIAASHRSLRDDYEVSTPELDDLVDRVYAGGDVLGSRLVGGGFGGSVIALTRRGRARAAADRVVASSERARLVAVVP